MSYVTDSLHLSETVLAYEQKLKNTANISCYGLLKLAYFYYINSKILERITYLDPQIYRITLDREILGITENRNMVMLAYSVWKSYFHKMNEFLF